MNIIMPQLGETVEEGTVAAWHKQEGDKVAVDELLLEIETDKVATEVPSLVAGTLRKILVAQGQTVKVGAILAVIDSDESAALPERSEPISAPEQSLVPAAPRNAPLAARGHGNAMGARLSPAVRRLIADEGIDITRIHGTGRDGRVKRTDVLSYLSSANSARQNERIETVPFSAMRKRIAEHMVRSQAASAHVLQAVEVDFGGVESARSALKRAWQDREGSSLTYLPFIARAVALALPKFSHLNAHVAGESLRVFGAINLSVAVDLDGGGLIAPVIKNAGALSVPEMARAIAKLATQARAGELRPDDVTGGTYSLTNNGSFGTFLTAPVINQPQVAILSVDGVHRRPWVVAGEGGEAVEIRPVGVLAQSFDHRAVDGAYSAGFLRLVKHTLETREWISEFLT
jgi:2-oxoglutarate dehydrogenase E2 component (dihydrolipoamide succinyltransferase)